MAPSASHFLLFACHRREWLWTVERALPLAAQVDGVLCHQREEAETGNYR